MNEFYILSGFGTVRFFYSSNKTLITILLQLCAKLPEPKHKAIILNSAGVIAESNLNKVNQNKTGEIFKLACKKIKPHLIIILITFNKS